MVWDLPSLGSDSILWAQSFLLWGEFLFSSVKLKVIRPLTSIRRIVLYLVVDSELREPFQPKLYVLHIVFFSFRSLYPFTCPWLLTIMEFISVLLCSQVLTGLTNGGNLSGYREVMLGSGVFIALDPFLSLLGLGESLCYGFLPGSLHWSPFLPVFGSTLHPYPLLPSNNSKVFNCS